MDIHAKLTEIFREVFMDDTIVLTDQLTANDVEGWDSFAHLNIILAVENSFDIAISDEESPGLKNIGDMIQLIRNKLSDNHQA
jgi:acyl carrier protein